MRSRSAVLPQYGESLSLSHTQYLDSYASGRDVRRDEIAREDHAAVPVRIVLCGVRGLGLRVQGFGFRDSGFGFRA
jgi:hypothetical protein